MEQIYANISCIHGASAISSVVVVNTKEGVMILI
jgi:hypothetical protein